MMMMVFEADMMSRTTVQTKKGSNVTRKGDKEDPAVVLDTGKTDAVKLSHELNETDN